MVFLFLVGVLLHSCQTRICEKSSHIESNLLLELELIQADIKPDGLISSARSLRGLMYIELLTGLESSSIPGDVTEYSIADLNKDKEKWQLWLAEDGCNISIDYSFKVKEQVLSETAWMGW